MAKTPIVLLATDYLLKGEGLAPSSDILDAIVGCKKLEEWVGTSSTPGESEDEPPTVTELWPGATRLADMPTSVVLGNLRARIKSLLGTVQFDDDGTFQIVPDEQAIRKFVSVFQASGSASSMTTETLDAAAALKTFKSFSDFGPNINNIQDLVTGGKTGSFPGGAAAMTKLGDSLKGMGSMYDPEALGDMGKASSLVKNLSSQGVLPASVTDKIKESGIDLDNMTEADEATLKRLMSNVKGAELEAITKSTGFAPGKLTNLSDALDASKVLPAGALSAIPSAVPSVPGLPGGGGSIPSIPTVNLGGAMYTNTSDEDLTYTGDDYIVWDRINTERRNRGLSSLTDLGYPRPPEDAGGTGTTFSSGGSDGMASLGTGLQSVAGTGNLADIGKKLSGVKVPELRHLMAAPPDFASISDSLKSKFSSITPPAVPSVPSVTGENLAAMAASLGMPAGSDLADVQAKAGAANAWLGSSRDLMPAGFDINKVSAPTIPGHIPKVPNIPGVPSIPLQVPGFAPGGAIDTSLYANTPDEDLTYTGDDHIVWDRVNTERLNRGLPDLAGIGSPRPEEPKAPATATPNGSPGVFQLLNSLSSEGTILPQLKILVSVSDTLPGTVPEADIDKVATALAQIQVALDQELGALTAAGIDLSYPGPTGYVGVTMFAEKLHQYGVDKQNLGLGRFIEELAESADSAGGDSVIAALYEGRNLAA